MTIPYKIPPLQRWEQLNSLFDDSTESVTVAASWAFSGTLTVSGTIDLSTATVSGLDASDITSGTFADARIAASNVTQHEAALTILESQITDGTILARLAADETITGDWTWNQGIVNVQYSGTSIGITSANIGTAPFRIEGTTGDLVMDPNQMSVFGTNMALLGEDGISFVVGDQADADNVTAGSIDAAGDWTVNNDLTVDGIVGIGGAPESGYQLKVHGDIFGLDDLYLQSGNPGIWFNDTTSATDDLHLVYDGGLIQFQRRSDGFGAFEETPYRFALQAPASTIDANSSGDVGIGGAPVTGVACAVHGVLSVTDGVTAPSTQAGHAQIYVDTADGDLKVKFGDGTTKTIATDT